MHIGMWNALLQQFKDWPCSESCIQITKKNIYECISKAVKYIDTQNQDGSWCNTYRTCFWHTNAITNNK